MSHAQENTRAISIGIVVGGLAILGGIIMFIKVVPGDLAGKGDLPRDMTLLFTNVFLEQKAHYNEKNRYAAALVEVKADPTLCQRYGCRLTVPPAGDGYIFRMTKDGRTWAVNEKHPVPKEEIP